MIELFGFVKTMEMLVKLFGQGLNETIGLSLSIIWANPEELFN